MLKKKDLVHSVCQECTVWLANDDDSHLDFYCNSQDERDNMLARMTGNVELMGDVYYTNRYWELDSSVACDVCWSDVTEVHIWKNHA